MQMQPVINGEFDFEWEISGIPPGTSSDIVTPIIFGFSSKKIPGIYFGITIYNIV